MKQVVDKAGNRIADLDDQNRIVQGHNRVIAHRRLGHDLYIKDGDTLVLATFSDDASHAK